MTEIREEGMDLPAGQICTFLIADVRGYTRFTAEHGDEAAARLARRLAGIAREIVSAHAGEVVELRGDEVLAVFSSARQGLWAAIDLQQRFREETMADASLPLKVGIGLDAGEAIPLEGGYRGGALNLAARLCSLAGPGEILASEGVIHLARKVPGLSYAERGAVQLKGFADPVRVIQVTTELDQKHRPDGATAVVPADRPLPIGGFLGALPATPLVGRNEELRQILSAVDAVAGGSGRLFLLLGEPGVGKTRLVQEVTLQLRNREFLVTSGRCYEPQEVVPFYPFLEALATLYASAPSAIRDEVPQRWPTLGHLLPNRSMAEPSPAGESRGELERLFWAVTGFVQAIAEQQPVALLLDDLHWADSTSLALLQHLARHTRAYRVLLLGTYRDIEVTRQHPLERAIRDLYREQLAERLAIRRLGEQGTAAFLAMTFGEEVSDAFTSLVHRYTEGNPFFTQEVLRTLVDRGDVFRQDGVWERRSLEEIEVPESVRSAIGERLSRLSDQGQEILHEASVLGQSFTFDELHGMGGKAESEIEDALEEACAADLVRETGRDTYSFNHALTQQTLYGELAGRKKRRMHLAAGEALEQLPDQSRIERAAELSRHFLEGDSLEQALRYALLAGDQAAGLFAHEEADRHYRIALDLAQELEDNAHEAQAVEKLGRVARYQLRHAEALEKLERAAALYREAGDAEGEGRVGVLISRIHTARPTATEGTARLEPLLERLQGQIPERLLAELYDVQSELYFMAGRYDDQYQVAERLLDMGQAAQDDRILGLAYMHLGTALSMFGRLDESITAVEQAIPRAEAAGDLYNLMTALSSAGSTYMQRGELTKALAYVERALGIARRTHDDGWIVFELCNTAEVLTVVGRWVEARQCLDDATVAARDISSWWAWIIPTLSAELSVLQGDMEPLQRQSDTTVESLEAVGEGQIRRRVRMILACIHLRQGQADTAVEHLELLVAREKSQGGSFIEVFPLLAEAYLAAGRQIEANQTVQQAIEWETNYGDRIHLVQSLRVRGMVHERAGRLEDAASDFAEAASMARVMPNPYAEAHALLEWGAMLARQKEAASARETLQQALTIFQRLGARADIERSNHVLASIASR